MAERRSFAPSRDDGKSTIILIGVLLVLIVLVGAGLLYIIGQKAPVEPPPVQDDQQPPPPTIIVNVTDECDEGCMLEEAVTEKDVSKCAELETLGQSCYEQLASESLDACMAVLDPAKNQECITAFAVADGDISLCDELPEAARLECRDELDACADDPNPELCHALEAEDPSLCDDDKDCLVNYSLMEEDSSSCDLIENRVVAAACKSAVLNSDRCYDLGEGSLRDYCYLLFAVYSGDYLTCTQTTPNSIYALDCFSLYAAHTGNYSVCNDDGFELNNRWLCYTNYSLMTGDTSGCSAIHKLASTSKFKCAFEFAKLHGDPSACNIIEDSGSRSTCYSGSIIYSNENLDWHNCAAVVNFEWRNSCYTEAAKLEDDPSICDNIAESSERESCESAVG